MFVHYGSFKDCTVGSVVRPVRSARSVRSTPTHNRMKFYFVFVIEFHGGGLPSSALCGKNKFKIWDFSTRKLNLGCPNSFSQEVAERKSAAASDIRQQ
jgi:hypothetical protein